MVHNVSLASGSQFHRKAILSEPQNFDIENLVPRTIHNTKLKYQNAASSEKECEELAFHSFSIATQELVTTWVGYLFPDQGL